ncbi:hypothetical protein BK666_18245 [Pseudomonas frederiksbergensis]|uniref:NADAR domain-containing protein n=1 Tax=Pseudomonas frederiksbergensis TaxID=104087 RepID=A0A423K0W6_9PSED|nr:NADAR family protein [Pseudomonas frederiksbergensis]RON44293.1 hypothetical protein BK666_18245 [Pseudomonas frederiksbergensis]
MALEPYKNYTTEDLRIYKKAEVIVVYKTKESFGGLSNMAGGFPLRVNGILILTTEALYQACRFPHRPEIQLEIIGQSSPMTAKMKSKPYRSETRQDWDQVSFKVMRWCLRVKLAQNYDAFGQLLLSTKNKIIVEQSKKDQYWGAKLTDDEQKLIGKNVLGRLLMELREKLKEDTNGRLREVKPLAIPNFHILGHPITTITQNQNIDDAKDPWALF